MLKTVGVPKEIKIQEYRVAMTPDGVREFERHGIEVFVQTGAGEGASFRDDDYIAAGATIVLASGRPIAGLRRLARRLRLDTAGFVFVGGNGSVAIDVDSGEQLLRRSLPRSSPGRWATPFAAVAWPSWRSVGARRRR